MTPLGKRGGKTPSQPEAQPWVIRIIPTGLFIFYRFSNDYLFLKFHNKY